MARDRIRNGYQRARSKEEKAERKSRILAAANSQMRETGWEGFTISSLAERAGIAKGTVYLYFETKEDILEALVIEHLSSWSAALIERTHEGMTDASFCRAFWASAQSDLLLEITMMRTVYSVFTADRLIETMRSRQAILAPLAQHIERCLGLGRGAGGRIVTCLWALQSGLAQMDAGRLTPELASGEIPRDVVRLYEMMSSEELFARHAPSIVAGIRSGD